jgi:hypothetical protein
MNQDDKEQEGILSTVQSAVVHSAQAGLEVAKSGIESGKDAAQAAGSAVASFATKAAEITQARANGDNSSIAKRDEGDEHENDDAYPFASFHALAPSRAESECFEKSQSRPLLSRQVARFAGTFLATKSHSPQSQQSIAYAAPQPSATI